MERNVLNFATLDWLFSDLEEIIGLNFQKTNLDGELDLEACNLQKLIVLGFYLEKIKNFAERTNLCRP